MAESAVSFLLEQLSACISQERQLLGSLAGSAEAIQDEMGHMRAFLRVADEKQEVDPQLREWVNQVRDVAYDAQDVMDKFVLRFAGRQADGILSRVKQMCVSIKNLIARHQIASEMKAIRSRIQRISESQQRYKDIYGTGPDQEPGRHKSTWHDSRGDALLLEEAEVVGIEKPKKQLVEWISSTKHTSGLKAISVVGSGGLGKTTLVKKVYDDAQVKMHFDIHVWITVSSSFKLEELLKTMIRRLVAEVKQPRPELEAMDANDMKEFVYKFLQHRRYLIVLDDVWRVDAWEAIRYAFPRSGTYGFIIITTRFHNIGHAASIENNGHVYDLKPLSQEESKKLFYRKAFLGGPCPGYLEEIAGIVLNKCEGLPLAIVVIGSLLATKNNDIEEWKKFLRSLADELEGDHLRRMTKLLSLSYYDLPYYLKSCFMYFSIFPEDHIVYMSRLIRLWVAEGFVQPKDGKTMEEVAEDYIKELLNRSLVQLEESSYASPPRVRVHDLLHAIMLSKSKEEGFVTIASGRDTKWPTKSRRLAIHDSLGDTAEIEGCHHLRSVVALDFVHPLSELDLSTLLASASKLLKVLELRGALSEKIPDEVFELYNLKYLGLKNTKVKAIPKSIKKLQNLETLDLRDTKVTELPVQILRLLRLRHLLVFHYHFHRGYRPFENVHNCKAPYRIGCLSSLQSVTDIEATEAGHDSTIVREIGKLTQLKILGIMKLRKEDGEDLCISLTKLTRLQKLYIASLDEDEIMDLQYPVSPAPPIRILELRGGLQKLPQWIPSLDGLTKLILRWSRINDDPLESIQHLRNLMELELSHAYKGSRLCFKAAGFQKLKRVWFIGLNGLRSIEVEEDSMPLLQELYMWGCKLVEEVPSGIEYLINLQYIDFSDMSEGFATALQNQKEDGGTNWKLAHIPKIEIYSLSDGEWQGRHL